MDRRAPVARSSSRGAGSRAAVPVAGRGAGSAVPLQRSAAMSHRRNDEYMEDFERAYEEMSRMRLGDGGSSNGAALPAAGDGAVSRAVGPSSRGGPSGAAVTAGGSSGAYGRLAAAAASGGSVSSFSAPGVQDGLTPALQTALSPGWMRGPVDPAGALADLSDRPLMAMATDGRRKEVAIACSDHAVYTVDMASGRKTRTLYGGKYGHTEWVTGVCYVGDGSGRVASAAMDAKICVWDNKPSGKYTACSDLIGHFGSVSLVLSPGGGTAYCGPSSRQYGGLLLSAGYDKTVRLWHANSSACVGSSKTHGAPVLCAALHAGVGGLWAVSGDRDGVGQLWDLCSGSDVTPIGSLKGHAGHVTSCSWLYYGGESITGGSVAEDGSGAGYGSSSSAMPLALTGAQDGHLRAWDVRAPPASVCVANVAAHTGPSGSGAIGDIAVTDGRPLGSGSGSSDPADLVVVTAGADRRIVVTDPRGGWRPRAVLTEHKDFIYSMWAVGPLILSGAGDGILLAHDISGCRTPASDAATVGSARILWGLGANAAAVRCIGTAGGYMVAAGDDGKALSYKFG